MGLGGSKPSLEEQLQSNKREVNRSIRELDRERNKLAEGEKKLVYEIKQAAQRGDINLVRTMARDLVRSRRHTQKFYEMRSQLQAVSLSLQTVKSTQAMAESMKGVAKVMVSVNAQTNIPALQTSMMSYVRESERLGLTEEMLSDVVEDAMGGVNDEEEEENVVNQVLDEIGVDLSTKLLEAPTRVVSPSTVKSQSQGSQRQPHSSNQPVGLVADPISSSMPHQLASPDTRTAQVEPLTLEKPEQSLSSSSSSRNVDELEKSIQQRLKNLKS